eukprot:CAMPEP_0185761890 /NCGR_PEP_ID=MMETSP1174-20130828/20838_1 /TAXON_ID=35687 /ORGANISM="Dictyocha speculum, Strain CCMP1381" /LENGTH=193 /DNA_ID=CAMNT_0028443317 /DNA_START=89 /DNA_END=667 /DNA_ORIENTATION=+
MAPMSSKNLKLFLLQHKFYSRGALFLLVITTLAVLFGLFRQQGQLAEQQNELTQTRDSNQKLYEQAESAEQEVLDVAEAFMPQAAEAFGEPEPEELDVVPPAPFMWIPLGDNNQFEGLHVVITSFCLGQGQFLELVAARLVLFKTLCLPTMLAQEVQSFLWLIYVDESLSPDVLEELETLLQGRSNFKIVQRS